MNTHVTEIHLHTLYRVIRIPWKLRHVKRNAFLVKYQNYTHRIGKTDLIHIAKDQIVGLGCKYQRNILFVVYD